MQSQSEEGVDVEIRGANLGPGAVPTDDLLLGCFLGGGEE